MPERSGVNEIDLPLPVSTTSPPWVAAAYCAAGMFSNYQREAKELDRALPALFFVGDGSADRAKTYLRTHLPNAQAECFGAHMMYWEYPDRFNAVLARYLEGLD